MSLPRWFGGYEISGSEIYNLFILSKGLTSQNLIHPSTNLRRERKIVLHLP